MRNAFSLPFLVFNVVLSSVAWGQSYQPPPQQYQNHGQRKELPAAEPKSLGCPKLLSQYVRVDDLNGSFFSWYTDTKPSTGCKMERHAKSGVELEKMLQNTEGFKIGGLSESFINQCIDDELKEEQRRNPRSRSQITEEQRMAIVSDYYYGLNRLSSYAKSSVEAVAAIDVMLGKTGSDFMNVERHQLLADDSMPGTKDWLRKIQDPKGGCQPSGKSPSSSSISKSALFEQTAQNLMAASAALQQVRAELQKKKNPGRGNPVDKEAIAKLQFAEAQILQDNPMLQSGEMKKLLDAGITPDSERQASLKKLYAELQRAKYPTGRGGRVDPARVDMLNRAISAVDQGQTPTGTEFQGLQNSGILPKDSFDKRREHAQDRYRLALLMDMEKKRDTIVNKIQTIRKSANCLSGNFDGDCKDIVGKNIIESPSIDPYKIIKDVPKSDPNYKEKHTAVTLARQEVSQSECRYGLREGVRELGDVGKQAAVVVGTTAITMGAGAMLAGAKAAYSAGRMGQAAYRARALALGVTMGLGEGAGVTAGFMDARQACAESAMVSVQGIEATVDPDSPSCPSVKPAEITANRDYFACQLSTVMAFVGLAGAGVGNMALLKSAKGATDALTEAGISAAVANRIVTKLQQAGEAGAHSAITAESKAGRALQSAGQHLMGKNADERTIRFIDLVKGLDDTGKKLLDKEEHVDSLMASIRKLDDMYKGKVPSDKLNKFMADFVKGQKDMDAIKGYNLAIDEAMKRAAGDPKQLRKHLEAYLKESLPGTPQNLIDEALECGAGVP